MSRFSVIIPVYNDPDGIRETLVSLLRLDYPRTDHEILVVDNASTDETRQVAQDIAIGNNHIRVVTESSIQSSYAARNKGIDNAEGEFLAFIDANMTVERSWLSDIESAIDRTGADYIGCNVKLYQPSGNNFVEYYNMSMGFPIRKYMKESSFAGAGCLVVRRSVVDDVGRFDSELISGGDREFGNRVAAAGYNQFFAEDITMYHPARTDFSSMMKKSLRIGKGQEQLYERNPALPGIRPWYHPLNFLPPHPIGFINRLESNQNVLSVFKFYIFNYLLKLVSSLGRITHKI